MFKMILVRFFADLFMNCNESDFYSRRYNSEGTENLKGIIMILMVRKFVVDWFQNAVDVIPSTLPPVRFIHMT